MLCEENFNEKKKQNAKVRSGFSYNIGCNDSAFYLPRGRMSRRNKRSECGNGST